MKRNLHKMTQQGPAVEDLESGGENFNKEEVRKGFLMRIYSILTCQLALTFGIILIFSCVDTVKEFSKETRWLVWVGLGALFALKVLLLFIEKVRRKTPFNYILLGVFTLVGGFFLGGPLWPVSRSTPTGMPLPSLWA